jgi:2-aminoadipate transaminase
VNEREDRREGGPYRAQVECSVSSWTKHPRSTAAEIERYSGLFAQRTSVMRSSAMRDLMALTDQDDVISLSGGLPDTSTFPADSFIAQMSTVAHESCAKALQYGPTEGLPGARKCVIDVMAAESMDVDADSVLVTTGGQQAIDLVCKILIDPGDVVIAEGPTYPGAVPTFCSYEADVIHVEMDRDGMQISELRTVLEQLDREGRRPKFIYTIPNFQNPGGVTMSLERRRELVQIASERQLLILEDNPYGLLRYEGDPLPTLFSLDREFVLYMGTFSKIFSPGARLGWVVAPPPVYSKLVIAKGSADLCSSSLSEFFVAAHFAAAPWLDYVRELSELYRRRRDVMLDSLAEQFPREATWTHPHGGLFIWATLPDYIDTTDLLARAIQERVAFVPGRAAYLDGRGGSSMRLNFSGVTEDEIREGIRRIGELVREQVSMYGTLTGETKAPGIPAAPPAPLTQAAPAAREEHLARVLHLPRKRVG